MGKQQNKKKRERLTYEEEVEADAERTCGQFFRDVQLLLRDYFNIGTIETSSTKYLTKKDEYTPYEIDSKFYPVFLFIGSRSPNAESEDFNDELQCIYLSLVNLSIHLGYECKTKLCDTNTLRDPSKTLDISSLIQSLPMEMFKHFTERYASSMTVMSIDKSSGILVVPKNGNNYGFTKKGYFRRWTFFTQAPGGWAIKATFTEKQDAYLLSLFIANPTLQKFITSVEECEDS